MKIAVLGTGMVGKSHAERLLELGHEVFIGTSDVAKTLAKTQSDDRGAAPFSEWLKAYPRVKLMNFEDAANAGELVIEALNGTTVVKILATLTSVLSGKILIDISNPLDFSKGMPPTLSVANTDSLGEQIQKALPQTRVVKTLNTVGAPIQVNPKTLAHGDHSIFMSGNDTAAKQQVKQLLESYGWSSICDLGDITTSRGPEMYLPLWIRMWNAFQNPSFNIKVVSDSTSS